MPIRPQLDRADLADSSDPDTLIVGAGMAGLACARRLCEARRPFLVITEDVGGRVHRSRDGAVNLGAYYVRADYTHVNQFVDLGRRIDRLAIKRHDGDNSYTYRDPKLLLHLPQAARFLESLFRFRRHYDTLKRRTPTVGQSAAIRADPWLLELYRRPALDWVRERRLRDIARWFLAPGLHGTAFLSLGDITAFTLLLGAMPVLVPSYEFVLRPQLLLRDILDRVVAGRVTGIRRAGDEYVVETKGQETRRAARVVVATPTSVAGNLLDLPATKRPVSAHMFQLIGEPGPRLGRGDLHLFADADPTLAIARQADGSIIFCSRERHPDFNRFFASWRVVEHHSWNPAFHLTGGELLEPEQGPNLFLVGDHNIVGLEDSYLTGLYAANQIIARSSPRRASYPGGPKMSQRGPASTLRSGGAPL